MTATRKDDRRRVARDLHDDVGQRAALLDLKLDRKQLLAGGSDAARAVLADLRADVAVRVALRGAA